MKTYLIPTANDDTAWEKLSSGEQRGAFDAHAAFHQPRQAEGELLVASHRKGESHRDAKAEDGGTPR